MATLLSDKQQAFKFNVELKAPLNPANIPRYVERINKLFAYTNRVSLASKPSGPVSGFDQNYNLAEYLLAREPGLDILFHLTCYDLNKVNIRSRLSLLKSINIRRVLIITGDDYRAPKPPDTLKPELFFNDSTELVDCIVKNFRWFSSIGIAGYPGGDGKSSRNNEEECDRLVRKLSLGPNVIYTQCVFEPQDFDQFASLIRQRYQGGVEIVPSVALFQRVSDLQIVSQLTRVSTDNNQLLQVFEGLDQDESMVRARSYLVNLCRHLLANPSVKTIDLCTFGKFQLALELMEGLQSADTPV